MPNSRHSPAFDRCPLFHSSMNLWRSDISPFQLMGRPSDPMMLVSESVTYVSGLFCYRCGRSVPRKSQIANLKSSHVAMDGDGAHSRRGTFFHPYSRVAGAANSGPDSDAGARSPQIAIRRSFGRRSKFTAFAVLRRVAPSNRPDLVGRDRQAHP